MHSSFSLHTSMTFLVLTYMTAAFHPAFLCPNTFLSRSGLVLDLVLSLVLNLVLRLIFGLVKVLVLGLILVLV